MTKFKNVLILGGPVANQWAFKLNDYLNPRWDIEIVEERKPDEDYFEWVQRGGLNIKGIVKGSQKYSGRVGLGFIGEGRHPSFRLRAKTLEVAGWSYCDTCVMGEAFRNGADKGIYQTSCTSDIPPEVACPVDVSWTKIADP